MKTKLLAIGVLSTMAFAVATDAAWADVKLHPIFTGNMVLQRDKALPVWGTADPGEAVSVVLARSAKKNSRSLKTIADAKGNWRVNLNPVKVGEPVELTVSGKNTITLKNILMGDVYICSGQSNMEWPMSLTNNAEAEIAAANFPNIRLLTVPKKIAGKPQTGFAAPTSWQVCTPQTIPGFSAVGYFFGRELNQKMGIPIGLINASWGGTVAEAWMSRNALMARDDMRERISQTDAKFEATPLPAGLLSTPNQPSVLYNGMIAPLVPFSVRGAIWYQGETNAGNPKQYQTLFPELIRDWRTQWNAKQDGSEFGFYFVQLASFQPRVNEPVQAGWADLREAQIMALSVPRTGMATILDIGDALDIHPRNKQDVGKRLALAALAKEYGRNVLYSGPTYKAMKLEGNEIRIEYSFAQGLKTRDSKESRGFAIRGEDGKWHVAHARLEGDTVVAWNNEVPKPVAVRYAWVNNPDVNLVNAANLPAVPFRTDTP